MSLELGQVVEVDFLGVEHHFQALEALFGLIVVGDNFVITTFRLLLALARLWLS